MLAHRDDRLGEIEELRKELAMVGRTNRGTAALLEQCERLRTARDRAREQAVNLQQAYSALRNEHAAVRQERDALVAAREQLHTERERLKSENAELRMDRDRLRLEVARLQTVSPALEDREPEAHMLDASRPKDGAPGPLIARAVELRIPDPSDGAANRDLAAHADGSEPAPPTDSSAPATGQSEIACNVASDPPRRCEGEGGDDLQQIRGIGGKLERALRRRGVRSLAQIAGWTEGEIDEIARNLGVSPKRIRQENWVAQARKLTEPPSEPPAA